MSTIHDMISLMLIILLPYVIFNLNILIKFSPYHPPGEYCKKLSSKYETSEAFLSYKDSKTFSTTVTYLQVSEVQLGVRPLLVSLD